MEIVVLVNRHEVNLTVCANKWSVKFNYIDYKTLDPYFDTFPDPKGHYRTPLLT